MYDENKPNFGVLTMHANDFYDNKFEKVTIYKL